MLLSPLKSRTLLIGSNVKFLETKKFDKCVGPIIKLALSILCWSGYVASLQQEQLKLNQRENFVYIKKLHEVVSKITWVANITYISSATN